MRVHPEPASQAFVPLDQNSQQEVYSAVRLSPFSTLPTIPCDFVGECLCECPVQLLVSVYFWDPQGVFCATEVRSIVWWPCCPNRSPPRASRWSPQLTAEPYPSPRHSSSKGLWQHRSRRSALPPQVLCPNLSASTHCDLLYPKPLCAPNEELHRSFSLHIIRQLKFPTFVGVLVCPLLFAIPTSPRCCAVVVKRAHSP